MSECRTPAKLNSDELFDKLLEECKKNQEFSESPLKSVLGDHSDNSNDCEDKTNFDVDNSLQKSTQDAYSKQILDASPEKILNSDFDREKTINSTPEKKIDTSQEKTFSPPSQYESDITPEKMLYLSPDTTLFLSPDKSDDKASQLNLDHCTENIINQSIKGCEPSTKDFSVSPKRTLTGENMYILCNDMLIQSNERTLVLPSNEITSSPFENAQSSSPAKSISPLTEKSHTLFHNVISSSNGESHCSHQGNTVSPYSEQKTKSGLPLIANDISPIKNRSKYEPNTVNIPLVSDKESQECSNVFSLGDSHTASYSISDMQCLDQAVENIILNENDHATVSDPVSAISDTYFRQGSHFGLNISQMKSCNADLSGSEISDDVSKLVNKSNGKSKKICNQHTSVMDATANNDGYEDNSQNMKSGTDGSTELDDLPSNPVFSPKSKAFPDIYLHKDKINILRQMSQVFNNEKAQCNVEMLEKSNNNLEGLGQPKKNNLIYTLEKHETVNINGDLILSINSEGTSPKNNDKISSENRDETLSNNSDKLMSKDSEKFLTRDIEEILPKKEINSNLKQKDTNVSGPVHLVSSLITNNEKKITVESFIGEEGENIDIIDGFTFVSCNSLKKLYTIKSNRKNHPYRKRNFQRANVARKMQLLRARKRFKKRIKQNSIHLKHPQLTKASNLAAETYRMTHENLVESLKHDKKSDKSYPSVSNHSLTTQSDVGYFKVPNVPGVCSQRGNIKIKKIIAKKKSSSKNEILYVYCGGNLITLAGSIGSLNPTDTSPLKSRVVLPNGIKYIDMQKKEALRAVRPIKINKDLAAFALSALQAPEKSVDHLKHEVKLKENANPINIISLANIELNLYKKITPVTNQIENESTFSKMNDSEMVAESINEASLAIDKKEKLNIKWTQADVIMSTVGSSSTQPQLSSKKNIYRFPSLSREMKRLDMNFISYDKESQVEISTGSNHKEVCNNETYCKLGCICGSLKCKKIVPNHCGRVDCMFECNCQIDNVGCNGIAISRASSVSILNIDKEHQDGLATKEKEFKKTVVQSGTDVYLVERDKRKRDIKRPERYRDSNFRAVAEEPTYLPIVDAPVPVSYILPEDYTKHVKKSAIEMPWYTLPNSVSVWCMFHKRYDCKCLFDPKYSHIDSENVEHLSSSSSDEMSGSEADPKELIEIGTQSSAIICQKLLKSDHNSVLENNHTYIFKYWIHNGEHHSARSCGYEMKNMRFENINKMPYHYPVPTKPLVMGMTAKLSGTSSLKRKKLSSRISPMKKSSLNTTYPFSSHKALNGRTNVNNFTSTNKLIKKNKNSATKTLPVDCNAENVCSKNEDRSLLTLHWMMKEEERRGELELDLSVNTPGRTIIVSEPRFKKLINMCIIGIVGLSSNHRCIISTVKSTEDLLKMQKIHQLIMNNTVDVGPNMKDIFCTLSGSKYRYVMIRCDSGGRWEIFGVVQKKKGDVEQSPPSKINICTKSPSNRTDEDNPSPIGTASDADQIPIATTSEVLQTENYVNEAQNKEDGLPFITEVISGTDPSISSLFSTKNDSFEDTISSTVHSSPPNLDVPETVSSVIINPTYLGPRKLVQGVSLASILPNESKITIKSLQRTNESTESVSHLVTTSDKARFILFPQLKSNDNSKIIAVPIEINPTKFLPTSGAVNSDRENTQTSIPSSSNTTTATAGGDHSYSNLCHSNITHQKRLFRPSILSSTKFVKKNAPNLKGTDTNKSCKFTPVYKLNSPETKVADELSKTEKDNDSLVDGKKLIKTLSMRNLKYPLRIYDISNGKVSALKPSTTTEDDCEQLFDSDDLFLPQDHSTDTASDLDLVHETSTDKQFSEKEQIGRLSSMGDPTRNSVPVSKPAGNQESSDLVVISTQSICDCSIVDMSINFRSVKLHWLSGTISKAVLSTITTQSGIRGVPVSLVVESCGKIIKFFGLSCQTASEVPILILGTDLATVRRKSKEQFLTFKHYRQFQQFFRGNPVKYFIKVNDQIFSFIYDRSGKHLIRLKYLLHKLPTNSNLYPPRIPIEVARQVNDIEWYPSKVPLDVAGKVNDIIYSPKVMESMNKMKWPSSPNTQRDNNIGPLIICKPSETCKTGKSLPQKTLESNFNIITKSKLKIIPRISINRKRCLSDVVAATVVKKTEPVNDIATVVHFPAIKKFRQSASESSSNAETSDVLLTKSTTVEKDPLDITSNLCDINSSSLFESSDKKAFGIACYGEKTFETVYPNMDEKNFQLKSQTGKKFFDLKNCSSPRKQCLKRSNMRDFDTGSDSFDDTSSCSATDTSSPPTKKCRRRVEKVAEDHNLREKLRRKAQCAMFSYLESVMFESSAPSCRENGFKSSKDGLLCDAMTIIGREEALSNELITSEFELRVERVKLMDRLQKYYAIVSESIQMEISELIKTKLVYPSAKEQAMESYKAKELILEDGIRIAEDGKVTFSSSAQSLPIKTVSKEAATKLYLT